MNTQQTGRRAQKSDAPMAATVEASIGSTPPSSGKEHPMENHSFHGDSTQRHEPPSVTIPVGLGPNPTHQALCAAVAGHVDAATLGRDALRRLGAVAAAVQRLATGQDAVVAGLIETLVTDAEMAEHLMASEADDARLRFDALRVQ
ncbi:hypothetical protein [Chitiniphilus shinanonensis]|uniref:hypothetical protein n=1 Tax=Chitiniphilus shinanonensis TaxID=553088 RepID=UPI0030515B3B